MKNMKTIIFDVDGVLIKDKDACGEYLWTKTIETDLGLTPEQVRLIFRSGDWISVLKGTVDTKGYFSSRFAALNITVPVDEFIEYWLNHDFAINTGIIPLIESLKKTHKLYVGTNQEYLRARLLQEKLGTCFDTLFSSCHIKAVKPEPAFFRYIETSLAAQPSDIIFIDDAKPNIEAAAELGWTCHHFQNSENLKNFIHSYAEVEELT